MSEVERLREQVVRAMARSWPMDSAAANDIVGALLTAVRAEERTARDEWERLYREAVGLPPSEHQAQRMEQLATELERVKAESAQRGEAIAASCEAQAAVCATSARAGVYRHCARMARDVTARVAGGGGA